MNPTIVLLHAWPYDIHSYTEVTPVLAARGYRVIVPYLRGYGTTLPLRYGAKERPAVGAGGVGHNLPQEAPHAFAEAIIDVSS
jgi:pimeloyl-ACP methyl ester carboxylesterase